MSGNLAEENTRENALSSASRNQIGRSQLPERHGRILSFCNKSDIRGTKCSNVRSRVHGNFNLIDSTEFAGRQRDI